MAFSPSKLKKMATRSAKRHGLPPVNVLDRLDTVHDNGVQMDVRVLSAIRAEKEGLAPEMKF